MLVLRRLHLVDLLSHFRLFLFVCIGSTLLKPSFITELLIFIWHKSSLDILKIKKGNSIFVVNMLALVVNGVSFRAAVCLLLDHV